MNIGNRKARQDQTGTERTFSGSKAQGLTEFVLASIVGGQFKGCGDRGGGRGLKTYKQT